MTSNVSPNDRPRRRVGVPMPPTAPAPVRVQMEVEEAPGARGEVGDVLPARTHLQARGRYK